MLAAVNMDNVYSIHFTEYDHPQEETLEQQGGWIGEIEINLHEETRDRQVYKYYYDREKFTADRDFLLKQIAEAGFNPPITPRRSEGVGRPRGAWFQMVTAKWLDDLCE